MNEDLFYQPEQITPEDRPVEILDLVAEPYPDKQRVKVAFRLSGYRKSLGSAITLSNKAGEQLASTNIVNLIIPQQEITMHLPSPPGKPGKYDLTLALYSLEEVESELEPGKVGSIQSLYLDTKTISFTIQ